MWRRGGGVREREVVVVSEGSLYLAFMFVFFLCLVSGCLCSGFNVNICLFFFTFFQFACLS